MINRWGSQLFQAGIGLGLCLASLFPLPLLAEMTFQPEWLTFRVNQLTFLYYHQVSMTGSAFWAPGVWINKNIEARLQLGTNLLKASSPSISLFFAPEVQGFVGYRFWDKLLLEVGTGFQYWMVLDGTAKNLYSVQGHYYFDQKALGMIESVFLGYTGLYEYQFHPQYRLGVQISF